MVEMHPTPYGYHRCSRWLQSRLRVLQCSLSFTIKVASHFALLHYLLNLRHSLLILYMILSSQPVTTRT